MLRRKLWVIASAPLLLEFIISHQPARKGIKLSISVLSSLHLLGYYLGTFLSLKVRNHLISILNVFKACVHPFVLQQVL